MIERIHAAALDHSLDPLVSSTDVFVTAVLHVGSKSLSHVLAAIERTKDRLLDVGAASEAARAQIISAVMAYWSAHPGVAITIVEKLLNYSILSPRTVTTWALVHNAGDTGGDSLSRTHIYELVFSTVMKVTGRVRQVVSAKGTSAAAAAAQGQEPKDQDVAMADGADAAAAKAEEEAAREREVQAMRTLFRSIESHLSDWAKEDDEAAVDADADAEHRARVRRWGQRWLRAFRRRQAIEEAFVLDAEKERKVSAEAAESGDA